MWKYKGEEIKSIDDMPEDTFGFIYEIEFLKTGKKYLGKKQVLGNRKRKIGKRETARLKEERKAAGEKNWWTVPKYKYVTIELKWQDYFSSNTTLQELVEEHGKDSFKREILRFCPNKKLLTYYENKYLYSRGVIEPDSNYFNDNISSHFYYTDFIEEDS